MSARSSRGRRGRASRSARGWRRRRGVSVQSRARAGRRRSRPRSRAGLERDDPRVRVQVVGEAALEVLARHVADGRRRRPSTSRYTGRHHWGRCARRQITSKTASRGAATSHSSTNSYGRWRPRAGEAFASVFWTPSDGRAAWPSSPRSRHDLRAGDRPREAEAVELARRRHLADALQQPRRCGGGGPVTRTYAVCAASPGVWRCGVPPRISIVSPGPSTCSRPFSFDDRQRARHAPRGARSARRARGAGG